MDILPLPVSFTSASSLSSMNAATAICWSNDFSFISFYFKTSEFKYETLSGQWELMTDFTATVVTLMYIS